MLETITFPEPVISVAIEPKTKADQDKMGDALQRLAEEDPTFRVRTDEETGQTIIAGMGELHLEVIVDRMLREFRVEANVGRPQVAYRETITAARCRPRGASCARPAASGQYGHVWLEIEPLERGAGFEFENKIVGGSIPREYIPADRAGHPRGAARRRRRPATRSSTSRSTLVDGSYHEVDSSEMAFKIAGSMALKDGACEKADPVLLEPIMRVEVDDAGGVHGRRDRRPERAPRPASRAWRRAAERAGRSSAIVPLAEMFGYATDLRSMTQGARDATRWSSTTTRQLPHGGRVIAAEAGDRLHQCAGKG